MKKLTISIVNYNAGNYLIKCLSSLSKIEEKADFDVYIIDNASSDGSIERAKENFPQVKFIENDKNIGFGAAHNIVLKKSTTPYVLTLNPDCEIPSGTIKYMLKFMDDNPDVGISTCKIEKADGSLDIAAHRGFPTPLASFLYFFFKNDRLYHLTDRPMNKVHEIDSGVGAFLLIRKSVLDKVGYFDEDYFLYAEDIDLCYRVKSAGLKVVYVPNVKIIHEKGISSGIKKHSEKNSIATGETRRKSKEYFYKTMIIFYKKHYANKYPFFVNWLVYLGINLKLQLAKQKKYV